VAVVNGWRGPALRPGVPEGPAGGLEASGYVYTAVSLTLKRRIDRRLAAVPVHPGAHTRAGSVYPQPLRLDSFLRE
jgi:hypothetical protein